MSKRFSVFVLCCLLLSFIPFSVNADETTSLESTDSVNLLADYTSANWQGDTLYLDEPSTAIYFMPNDKKEQSATVVFERSEADTGFYFRADAGNGGNSGKDSGYCTIGFFDEEKNLLLSLSSGQIQNLDNYTRFYIGEEATYFPIPQKTKTVEVTLHAVQNSSGKRVNVYFRNLLLCFGKEKPLMLYEKKLYLDSSAGLTKVEIGVTQTTRFIWIGIIFLVALAFYIIRLWQQKYATAKVMKSTDRKTK